MEPTMSEGQAESSKPVDPLEPFREMRDAYLDAMAKVMVDTVNTEGYAKATGAMLDNSLTVLGPFREAMEKSMLPALQPPSLPSRQDIAALTERCTNLEMRLDDMDAKLHLLAKPSQATAPTPQAKPAKPTRKSLKTQAAKPVAAKAAVKRARPAKQTPLRKRAARKGTR